MHGCGYVMRLATYDFSVFEYAHMHASVYKDTLPIYLWVLISVSASAIPGE